MSTQENLDDLRENILLVVNDYIRLNTAQYIHPHFHATILKEVTELFVFTVQDILEDESLIELIQTNVDESIALFYKHIAPPRSNGPTFIRRKPNLAKMEEKIAYLQSVPQPEQRTPEWYAFRYKHLTASNIWKVFISDSTRNQLIFEKCQPLNAEKYKGVSLDSPMHWGQKYEPVSIALYEQIYAAPVSDFGCIPHKSLEFLAASPDGIVTAKTSARYGRMLEVKNIVNREITGIPKMEYWVQMQLQMEVCELNECDFLETRFQEYADKEAFETDATAEHKGMMILFMSSGGKPVYEYAPLNTNYETWQETIMEKNETLTWIKNIYWKLDQLSCVLVLRNKLWFAAIVPQLKDIWMTIEKEKQNGYGHREPKKTAIKVKKIYQNVEEVNMQMQCFIDTANL
jgi:putative phage-type endonuclease